jgi:hypothetical protein
LRLVRKFAFRFWLPSQVAWGRPSKTPSTEKATLK